MRSGQTKYQLRLKMDGGDHGPSYRADFDTQPDERLTFILPLQSFEPVFRGRIVENAPALAAERMQEIGFLFADKRSSKFILEVGWIDFTTWMNE